MSTYLYFDNGHSGTPLFNTLDVASESSAGAWSSPVACTLNGTVMSFGDPQINLLPNGQYLLAYTTFQVGQPSGGGEIDTAVSSDGVHFTSAQLAVAAPANSNVSDPSIVQLHNGTFLMVVAVNGPAETTETFYSSSDGRNWTATGASIPNIGGGGLAVMPDGSIRFFAGAPGVNGGADGVNDFISFDNGQTWSSEPGLCVVTPSDAGLPSVWQAAPGQYDMVFQTLINPNGPDVPGNQELSLATSTDGRNFTITQPDFLIQGSSADGIEPPSAISPPVFLAAGDFAHDGTSDALWQNTDGSVVDWELNGSHLVSSATVGALPPNWHFGLLADVNGDGKSDALWQSDGGGIVVWEMNGPQVVVNQFLGQIPTNWHLAASGDFNGDGKGDVLLHSDSGGVVVWTMNGAQVVGDTFVGQIPSNWHVGVTGDFNGDGNSDVLLHSDGGGVVLWTMNGAHVVGDQLIGQVPTNWQMAGAGDFNGDGKTDVLWLSNSGNVVVWLMNGTQVIADQFLGQGPANYKFGGIGDFDGDHQADIMWIGSNNTVLIWDMNGTQIASSDLVTTGALAVGSSVANAPAVALAAGEPPVTDAGTNLAGPAPGAGGSAASAPAASLPTTAGDHVGGSLGAPGPTDTLTSLLNHDQHFLV